MRNEVMFDEAMAESRFDAMFEKIMADKDLLMSADLDDAYEACRKYIDLTKEEFAKYIDYAEALMNDDGESTRPLTELELKMVAGGWFGSDAWNWVKNKVSSAVTAVKKAVTDVWDSGTAGKVALIAGAVGSVAAITVIVGGAVLAAGEAAGAAVGVAAGKVAIELSPGVWAMV